MTQIIITDPRLRANTEWLPRREHDSAGLDLRAMFGSHDSEPPLVLQPGCAQLVPTGFRLWLNSPHWVGLVFPRSGTGHKKGIVLGMGTGVIDADYQGPLMVSLLNRTSDPVSIELGERVAQLVITPVMKPDLTIVEEFTGTTQRGEGGFGSTGNK